MEMKNSMKKAGIARRMILVQGASALITLAAIAGLSYLLRISATSAENLVATARTQNQSSFALLDLLTQVQGTMQKLVQATDPDVMESLVKQNESLVKQVQAKVQEVAAGESSVETSFTALVQANEEVKSLVMQGRNAESHQAVIEKSNPSFAALLGRIAEYQNKLGQRLNEQALQVKTRTERREFTILGLAGVGVLLLIAFGAALVRNVSKALTNMIAMVKDVAQGEGDLTKRLQAGSQDELGELAKWFNTFLDKLHRIIAQVAATAEHVASASEELSSSATLQAQGAETQRDQTAQVATALQEMAATVLQVSEHSNKAAVASRDAADTAREGGSIVETTLTAMHAMADSVGHTAKTIENLGKSSEQIGRIVGVIDDIADQTNLLALNAAIEAARAGDQGRGFAVVADEVRKLAERTTTATKEIAQMINAIQHETQRAVVAMEDGSKRVEEGVSSTARAGDSLKSIIHMSEQVGEMITHIATAAKQESSATQEVEKSMEQIARLVKESSVGSQESAKACQELSGLALDLQNMVANFKLAEATKPRVSEPTRKGSAFPPHKMTPAPPQAPAPQKALTATAH
jgi:methyl-accepting chemotaxis protein